MMNNAVRGFLLAISATLPIELVIHDHRGISDTSRTLVMLVLLAISRYFCKKTNCEVLRIFSDLRCHHRSSRILVTECCSIFTSELGRGYDMGTTIDGAYQSSNLLGPWVNCAYALLFRCLTHSKNILNLARSAAPTGIHIPKGSSRMWMKL